MSNFQKLLDSRRRLTAKAKEIDPFCARTSLTWWKVSASDGKGWYRVGMPYGNLRLASCNCPGRYHPYCYHRLAVLIRYKAWLKSDQAKEFKERGII